MHVSCRCHIHALLSPEGYIAEQYLLMLTLSLVDWLPSSFIRKLIPSRPSVLVPTMLLFYVDWFNSSCAASSSCQMIRPYTTWDEYVFGRACVCVRGGEGDLWFLYHNMYAPILLLLVCVPVSCVHVSESCQSSPLLIL